MRNQDWHGKRAAIFRLGICNCVSGHADFIAVGCQGKQIFLIDTIVSRIIRFAIPHPASAKRSLTPTMLSCTKVDLEPISLVFSSSGESLACFFASETLPKLDFSPSTDLVVYNHKDGTIQRSLRLAGPKQSRFVTHPCWAAYDSVIVSGSEDSSIFCWTKLGVFVQHITGHSGPINQVHSMAAPNMLVSASDDKTIRFWMLEAECVTSQPST
jgi:WD40 repeat protein